jgi:hypothetical protein
MADPDKTVALVPFWLRVVLGVSLALNLLVLGLVGGTMVRYGGLDGMRPPPRSVGAALFRALPGEDRRALWDRSYAMPMANGMSMSENMPKGHHARQMAQARAVSAALRVTPFDRQALAAILQEQAVRREGLQQSVQQAWLDRVADMTDEERLAYSTRLDHAMDRPRFKERRKKSRGD